MGPNSRHPAPGPLRNWEGRGEFKFNDRSRRALSPPRRERAQSTSRDPDAAPAVRRPGRPATGGGRPPAADPLGPPPQHHAVGTAGQRQDDAGRPARDRDQRPDGGHVRRDRGCGRPAQGGGRSEDPRAGGSAHRALHRRDPPLQQGAAGRDLPHVEDGTVTLIGATTENPSFEVISPLLSRSRVYRLEALGPEELEQVARRGLDELSAQIEPEALAGLVEAARGDARIVLNALETAAALSSGGPITLSAVEQALQERHLLYDRAGDMHYDMASALIKSIRGSDPDAAVYWLARMLEAGEDPNFVARRLVILASEDVGLADPMALPVAGAAPQGPHLVGPPGGRFPPPGAPPYPAPAPPADPG